MMAGRMAFFCVFHRTREMKLHWFLLGKLIAHCFLHKGKEASHLLSPAFLPASPLTTVAEARCRSAPLIAFPLRLV